MEKIDGKPAWIVGKVVEGEGKAILAEDINIIEV